MILVTPDTFILPLVLLCSIVSLSKPVARINAQLDTIGVYLDNTTVIYIRGDIGTPFGFGYNVVQNNWLNFNEAPIAAPLSAPPTSAPVSPPHSTPSYGWPRFRFISGFSAYLPYTLSAIYLSDYSRYNVSGSSVSGYQNLFSGSGVYTFELYTMWNELQSTISNVAISADRSLTFLADDFRGYFFAIDDFPSTYDPSLSYLRFVFYSKDFDFTTACDINFILLVPFDDVGIVKLAENTVMEHRFRV